MNILTDYKIEKIEEHIYSVHINNKYDRAMTFCRAQEYYESPNPNFKGKAFSIWNYIKWYSLHNAKGFTYGLDWSGFNIPIKTIKDCYKDLKKQFGTKDLTIYDNTLLEIVKEIEKVTTPRTLKKCYLIGVNGKRDETFRHEICHGLYSTNQDYREKAQDLINELEKSCNSTYKRFEKNLLKMGYSKELVNDEIQAYLQFGMNEPEFCEGTPLTLRKQLNAKYKKILYNAFSNLKGV